MASSANWLTKYILTHVRYIILVLTWKCCCKPGPWPCDGLLQDGEERPQWQPSRCVARGSKNKDQTKGNNGKHKYWCYTNDHHNILLNLYLEHCFYHCLLTIWFNHTTSKKRMLSDHQLTAFVYINFQNSIRGTLRVLVYLRCYRNLSTWDYMPLLLHFYFSNSAATWKEVNAGCWQNHQLVHRWYDIYIYTCRLILSWNRCT